MKRISTHILDMVQGKPAPNVLVRLEKRDQPENWRPVTAVHSDRDGRCTQLVPPGEDLPAGVYRLIFDVGSYYAAQNIDSLYPVVEVTFQVRAGESNFHVPLLLSPNGYTTYRGS